MLIPLTMIVLAMDAVDEAMEKLYHDGIVSERDRKPATKAMDAIGNVIDATLLNEIRELLVGGVDEADLSPGDEIFTHGPGFTHHGIYTQHGVIHYSKEPLDTIRVRSVSFSKFADGKKVYKSDTQSKLPANRVVARAQSKLGEEKYNPITNECEHFCRWCKGLYD